MAVANWSTRSLRLISRFWDRSGHAKNVQHRHQHSFGGLWSGRLLLVTSCETCNYPEHGQLHVAGGHTSQYPGGNGGGDGGDGGDGGSSGGGGSGGGGDGAMSHGQTLWYFTSFTLLLAHEKSVEEGLG